MIWNVWVLFSWLWLRLGCHSDPNRVHGAPEIHLGGLRNGAWREQSGAKRNGLKGELNAARREPKGWQKRAKWSQMVPNGDRKGAKGRLKCIENRCHQYAKIMDKSVSRKHEKNTIFRIFAKF